MAVRKTAQWRGIKFFCSIPHHEDDMYVFCEIREKPLKKAISCGKWTI